MTLNQLDSQWNKSFVSQMKGLIKDMISPSSKRNPIKHYLGVYLGLIEQEFKAVYAMNMVLASKNLALPDLRVALFR